MSRRAARSFPVLFGALSLLFFATATWPAHHPASAAYPGRHAYDATWSVTSYLGTPRSFPGAVTGADGRIFVFGGFSTPYVGALRSAEVYDPHTGLWSSIASMPTARGGPGVALGPNGLIYVIGGSTSTGTALSVVEVYHPGTDSWTTAAPMPTGRRSFVAVSASRHIYAIGGRATNGSYLYSVDVYDPATNRWSSGPPLQSRRGIATGAVSLDGTIYIFGGWGGTPAQADVRQTTVEKYRPGDAGWSYSVPLPTANYGVATTGLDGLIYLIGGYDNDTNIYLNQVIAYDPVAGIWSTQPGLTAPKAPGVAVTGADGRLYAIGGITARAGTPLKVLNSVESYMPASAVPTPTGTATAVANATATALPAGSATSGPTNAPRCATVTLDTFDQCIQPSVLRVIKSLPGGVIEQGSAFVVRSDATGTYLATNQHVVDNVPKSALAVVLSDGRTRYAVSAVISTGGSDGTLQDLALILLQPTKLRPLLWGDSSVLHSLQTVIAVGYGNPFSLQGPPTDTQGIVNATHRDLGSCGGAGWIQHDAAVIPGNSGGPLLDEHGRVIGINTLKFDAQSACPALSGLGFAIPSATARVTLDTMARLLPEVRGGLISALSARIEIAARHVASKTVTLPYLRFQVPLTWLRSGEFISHDGRVSIKLSARTYRQTPTPAQLLRDASQALAASGPFTGEGVSPLAVGAFSGLMVTALPARHRYLADGLAMADGEQQIEVTVVRLVDPAATPQDRLEADSLLLSLVAVP